MGLFIAVDRHGDRYLDLEAFGRALAAALGCPIEVKEPGRWPNINIDLGDGLQLGMRGLYGANAERVELHVYVEGAGRLDHHARPSVSGIKVLSSRPMASIAADVQRRLIAPGRVAAEATAALLAEREGRHVQLKQLASKLQKAFPGLSITVQPNATYGDVYFNREGGYLSGSIDAEGKLSIQRFTVSTPAQALRVFDLLAGKL